MRGKFHFQRIANGGFFPGLCEKKDDTGAFTGFTFDCQITANAGGTFLQDLQAEVFAGSTVNHPVLDTDAVILDKNHVIPVFAGTHQHTHCVGFAVFANIHQGFLNDT